MNRLFYMLALLLTLYASIFYDVMYFRAFFVVLILLPLVLYCLTRYQKNHLTVSLRLDTPTVRKRTPFNIRIIADNDSPIPIARLDISLTLENKYAPESGKVKLRAMVDQESDTSINYKASSQYCGRLSIKADTLKIYDIFGITYCRLDDSDHITAIVLPEVHAVEIQVSPVTNSYSIYSDEYDPHKSGDDASEIFGFRNYQSGDRPNRVNWKLSVKSDELVVKDYSLPIGYNVILFLDFAAKETDIPLIVRADSFIETAASLSNSMLSISCYHYVCWYSPEDKTMVRQSIKSEEDLSDLLYQLLLAKPYKETVNLIELYRSIYTSDTQYSRLRLDMNLRLHKNTDDYIQLQPERLRQSLLAASIEV